MVISEQDKYVPQIKNSDKNDYNNFNMKLK